MADDKLERRIYPAAELRVDGAEGQRSMIRGHAAVYDQLSEDLGGFRERIAAGAFTRTLKDADVRALINHDANLILGRNRAGTLRLAEDDVGLAVEIDPPDTQYARDLMHSIDRRDITGMSFGFYTVDDRWAKVDGEWVRTLLDVELFDVSPVAFPAYPQTGVAVRGLEAARAADMPEVSRLGLQRRRLALM